MSSSDELPIRASLTEETREAAMRVISAATDLSGDGQKALSWYRTEALTPFGHKTAEALVNEGRAADLLRYLRSLTSGAAG